MGAVFVVFHGLAAGMGGGASTGPGFIARAGPGKREERWEERLSGAWSG
jgi:hypothetical protein